MEKKKKVRYRFKPWVKYTLLSIFIIISFVSGYKTSRGIHAIGIDIQKDIQFVNSVINNLDESEIKEKAVTVAVKNEVKDELIQSSVPFERTPNIVKEPVDFEFIEENETDNIILDATEGAVSGIVEPDETEPVVDVYDIYGYTQDEMNLIYAIVRQEGGPTYESALAVISSAINRTNSDKWAYLGSTVLEQLIAPEQYCYSIDDYWKQYLNGNVEDEVKEAVQDGLSGITSHDWTCFRSYPVEGATNIGGNYYFGD